MSDPLSNYLMHGTRHASLSPEALELMGKQAANRFLNEGLSLNESISKLAAEHPDIGGEQVKRIAEFANNAVYLAKHDQSKTAGAESSYPQFELADPARIIQDMSDGARPTVSTPTDIEYSRMPERTKTASVEDDGVLEQIFGQPTPSKDYSRETAVTEIHDTKVELEGLRANLETRAEHVTMSLKEAQAEYYDQVKRHLLGGGNFADVIVAAQTSGEEKGKIAQAFQPVIERLLREKVASATRLQVMTEQLEKVAHRVVNEEHPLVVNFRAILSLQDDVEKVAAALTDVDEQIGRVKGFIKEQFLASNTH